MLLGFLGGLAAHLTPEGEGWLLLSDLAEHLGLRSRDELLAAIEEWTIQRTTAECESVLMKAGVPCGRYRTVDEVLEDPHEIARGSIAKVGYGSGQYYQLPNAPFQISESNTSARDLVAAQPVLRQVLEQVASGVFSPSEPDLYKDFVESLFDHDHFLVLSDFAAYARAQSAVEERWGDQTAWRRSMILNTANMGWFSSDRTIAEYAREIWDAPVLGQRGNPALAGNL